jgi:fructokinase
LGVALDFREPRWGLLKLTVGPGLATVSSAGFNLERLYREVPAQWGAFVFSDRVATPFRRAAHGDSSGVRGAAWLWPDDADGR